MARYRTPGLARRARGAGLAYVWTLRAENEFLPPDLKSAGDATAQGDLRREIDALLDAGITGFFRTIRTSPCAHATNGGTAGR